MKKLLQRFAALAGIGALLASAAIVGVAAPASANNIDVTCTTAWLEPHRALTNGDHINIDMNQNGNKFQVNAYVDQNIPGGADVNGLNDAGLRLATPNGQVLVPLTAEEVTSGRLTFNFGQYLTGAYSVEWVQFNNSYFNQNRDPSKFLTCEQPPVVTPLVATANIVTTTATCQADGTAAWTNLVNATGSVLDQTPGTRQGTATATGNAQFAGGSNTLVKDYTIEAKLAANAPPCFTPPTNQCVPGAGVLSTDLNDLWQNVDTRADGRVEYVDGGLHVWTLNNSDQAKVSEGIAHAFDLKNTGVLDLNWTGSTPAPGINLFVTFAPGVTGTLVYESVYGQDLWLTNGSSQAAKDNAPVIGGGNGSQYHGTINQWLSKYPDAKVSGIAYSLGSGVLGDGVINSITVNCTLFTFDKVDKPAPLPPEDAVTVVVTETDLTCESTTRDVTTTTTTVTTSYAVELQNGAYVQVPTVGSPVVTTVTDTRDLTDAEIAEAKALCSVVVPPAEEEPPAATPTPTPSPTPVVATPVAGVLPATGGEAGIWALTGIMGLLLLGAGTYLVIRQRRKA